MTVLSCRFFKIMLLSTVSFVSTRVYQSHEPMLTLMSQFGVSTPHTAKSCSFHFFRPWVDGKPSHRFLNRDTVLLSFLCPERQLRGLWVSRRGLTPSSSSTGGTGPTVLSPREPRSHWPVRAPRAATLSACAHHPGFGFSSKLSYVVNKLFKNYI